MQDCKTKVHILYEARAHMKCYFLNVITSVCCPPDYFRAVRSRVLEIDLEVLLCPLNMTNISPFPHLVCTYYVHFFVQRGSENNLSAYKSTMMEENQENRRT